MVCHREVLLKELRDILLLALLGIFLTWAGITCRDCYDNVTQFWIIASFTSLLWICLWKGNAYLADYIDHKISWLDAPLARFVVGLLAATIYTFLALYIIGAIYAMSFDMRLIPRAWYSVIITVIISLFMHGRQFLLNWKQSLVNGEKLERENIAAKYESLKNQVNPHFLFNSFNALTNLVYEDQAKAVTFIKQLSEVYRYVLDTREKEVVPLADELKFIESYLYLQQIRFGEKLKIENRLEGVNGFVAPLALQMLIENAIKHNIVSEDDPLLIRLFEESNFIVVENILQKKMSLPEPSPGVGLENICKRYEFLCDRKVEILKDDAHFAVKLPMLTKPVYEGSDHRR